MSGVIIELIKQLLSQFVSGGFNNPNIPITIHLLFYIHQPYLSKN